MNAFGFSRRLSCPVLVCIQGSSWATVQISRRVEELEQRKSMWIIRGRYEKTLLPLLVVACRGLQRAMLGNSQTSFQVAGQRIQYMLGSKVCLGIDGQFRGRDNGF